MSAWYWPAGPIATPVPTQHFVCNQTPPNLGYAGIIASGIADGIRHAMEPLHMVGTAAAYVGVIATILVGAVVIAAACVVAYYGIRMLLKLVM
jgi:hypothetical protein